MRKDGAIVSISDDWVMPDDSEALVRELYDMAKRSIEESLSTGDDDFSLSVPEMARFRVNTYRQRGSMVAVIRVVNIGIPDWKKWPSRRRF